MTLCLRIAGCRKLAGYRHPTDLSQLKDLTVTWVVQVSNSDGLASVTLEWLQDV